MAPVLQKAPGVSVKEVQRDKEFLGLVERCGVDVGGEQRKGGGGGERDEPCCEDVVLG